MTDEAIFVPEGDLLVPTAHALSPWGSDQLHGGAPAALVVRAVEALETPVPMQVVRVTLEFAGTVPRLPLTTHAAITRPGKRLCAAEAEVLADGRPVVRARAALLRIGDVDVPDTNLGLPDGLPGPEEAVSDPDWGAVGGEAGFHLTGNEIRFARGGFTRPGTAFAWIRLRVPVVLGEPVSPAMRAAAAADFGNGLSSILDWSTSLFINCDLSVGLHRPPQGEWIGVDARTDLDRTGIGQARGVLHDGLGPVGHGAQSLFVDRR